MKRINIDHTGRVDHHRKPHYKDYVGRKIQNSVVLVPDCSKELIFILSFMGLCFVFFNWIPEVIIQSWAR